jgi:hypothetical protein
MTVPHPEHPNKTIITQRQVVFMFVTSFQRDYTIGWESGLIDSFSRRLTETMMRRIDSVTWWRRNPGRLHSGSCGGFGEMAFTGHFQIKAGS